MNKKLANSGPTQLSTRASRESGLSQDVLKETVKEGLANSVPKCPKREQDLQDGHKRQRSRWSTINSARGAFAAA